MLAEIETRLSIKDKVRIGVGIGSAALYGAIWLNYAVSDVSKGAIAAEVLATTIGIMQAAGPYDRMRAQARTNEE